MGTWGHGDRGHGVGDMAAMGRWGWRSGDGAVGTNIVTLDPPWMPVFVWERVTLTCHGPGAPVPTRWFEGDRLLKLAESDRLQVSRTRRGSSSYRCQRHGAATSRVHWCILVQRDPRAHPRPSLADWLVLQVPAQALLEGDTPWLRCQGWGDAKVTRVRFYREQEELGGPTRENDSLLAGWQVSAPVAVTPEGAPLTLSCLSRLSPLRP
uniref:Ig-like domain-containing protein n=1 Tax=Otus sunia TaxID=257818 RepID=A0A8C8B8V9_9STRI